MIRRRASVALSAALFFSLFLQVSVSHAATFTVNSTADAPALNPGNGICITAAGTCTLRAAIQAANEPHGGADTIVLPAGIYVLTIPGANEDAAATGDLDITQDLTIIGAGAATTIIDGNGGVTGDRVLQLSGASVRISGVTIRGGTPPGTDGGGIYNRGILTLDDVVVTQNTAGNNGGGLFNATVAAIRNSTVSDNTSSGGGGIYSQIDLTLTNTTLSGNRAGGIGGGILNSGVATLARSTISENTGGRRAGRIFSQGTLTLNATTVSENQTSDPLGAGGGVDSLATLNLSDSTIRGNTARFGGGISSSGGPVTINRSSVLGNTARDSGGGIRHSGPIGMEVNDSTIQGNNAPIGGGMALFGSSATIRRSTLSGNTASIGGGIGSLPDDQFTVPPRASTLTVEQSALRGNTATIFGGGIFNFPSTLALTNGTVSGNAASQGGGLFNEGSATLTNSTFSGNTARPAGGGILNAPGNAVTLLNTVVANSPFDSNCSGAITSNGHNLSSDGSCALLGPGDLNNANPNLGPLADNGGPTQTHALPAGSPAIDAGSNTGCPSTDQRGFLRPTDGNGDGSAICDIGAYEFQLPIPKNRAASAVGSGAADSPLGPVDFSVSVGRTVVGGPITGSITKTVRNNGRGLRSTEITELVVLSSSYVIVKGMCVQIPTGEACTFRADLTDGGPGGVKDVFLIATNKGPQLGGRLLSGDITITLAP